MNLYAALPNRTTVRHSHQSFDYPKIPKGETCDSLFYINVVNERVNAHVEIYDLNGKLVCNQQITENITLINAQSWPSGAYVWKVVAKGKETECGKWIKQ